MYRRDRFVIALVLAFGAVTPAPTLAVDDVFNLPGPYTSLSLVSVGNPGNPGKPCGSDGLLCGGVDYRYKISKYETTAAQYTQFLNAVATSDIYGLYDPFMADPNGAFGSGIHRSGAVGSYSYSVDTDWANRPVHWLTWGSAARFANWLTNGQPAGPQGLTTTEDGSYFLNGATSNAALMAVTRKPGATFVLPTEDEWDKAAYHKNDGPTDHYWRYATGSDVQPSNELINPDPGNNANYKQLGFYTIGPPYYKTLVGEFENSESPYGTFDQMGNVAEWNESVITATSRGLEGGNAFSPPIGFGGAPPTSGTPSSKGTVGFRIAFVPEPATAGLLALAGLVGARRSRSRR